MYTLRVTAPKLNIRNSPDADRSYSNWIGETHAGDLVTAVEKINDWYKDDSNRYYWSGGLTDTELCPAWMMDLRLPEIWHYATGKGVGVAVVDSGIETGIDDLPYDTKKFFVFNSGESMVDSLGHGTHCAGLIGARNKHGKYIGVAPDCNLFICKISEYGDLPEPDGRKRYAAAIRWCADQPEVHVISISWAHLFPETDLRADLQQSIDYAVLQKNKIVVCSIGNTAYFKDATEYYPACCNNTLATASIPINNVLYTIDNPAVTSAVKGDKIESYFLGGVYKSLSGTSQSNAIMAGIVALIIEKKNKRYTYNEIHDTLKNICQSTTYTQDNDSIALPVLNPDALFSLFKF